MRYFIVVALLFCVVLSAPAQDVDISDIEPRDLDPELLDLSEASFYFQGPVQVYVHGLKYGDARYAAVLDYDGGNTVEIFPPEDYGADMRPKSIDLSNVEIAPNPDGTITLENAIVDGGRYAATLEYMDGRTLAATEGFERLGPAPSAEMVSADKVERLQSELSEAEETIEKQEGRIEELRSGNQRVAELQDRIEDRDQRISSLRDRVSTLEARVNELESPSVPRLSRRLHSGFSGRSNSFGQWALSGSTLEQTDGDARLAKTVYPVRQSGTEFTYTVEADAADSGWVGYGVHLLAGDAETTQGYGYGDSYLLWVTRDPSYQTNRGYVQLYRSFNDVHMVQVASAVLPVSDFDGLETTVYTDSEEGEIQVFLEGRYAFTFPTDDLKNRAPEVALRALGSVTFTDLTIRGE